MPPSISHEGYSAKPAYSYWDDFWALRRLPDAVDARAVAWAMPTTRARFAASARRVPRRPAAPRWRRARSSTASTTCRAPPTSATSTRPRRTIALAPGGAARRACREALLRNTFERYWRDFVARRDGGKRDWDAYTPYEWRNVGAFVRLGWRERAHAGDRLLHARPPPGRLEPVGRGRAARPARAALHRRHAARRGSPRTTSARCSTCSPTSDEGERSLVLAAGVPLAWFERAGPRAAGSAHAVRPAGLERSHAHAIRASRDRDRPPGAAHDAPRRGDRARTVAGHVPGVDRRHRERRRRGRHPSARHARATDGRASLKLRVVSWRRRAPARAGRARPGRERRSWHKPAAGDSSRC